MDNLAQKKCVPCEGGIEPLGRSEIANYLEHVPRWEAAEDKKIERSYAMRDFAEALRFVNEIGRIAEEEGHHPDICIHNWNKVRITLWTHAIGGLSINDFIMAGKIDRIEI